MQKQSNIIEPFLKDFETLIEDFNIFSKPEKGFPFVDVSKIHNEKNNQNILKIELAVAGFQKKDLTIDVIDNINNNYKVLIVTGKKQEDFKKQREEQKQKYEYILQTLSFRNFKKEFVIYEQIEKIESEIQDGILTIEVYEKPKEQKEKIEISWKQETNKMGV